jgi:hypothetical protein
MNHPLRSSFLACSALVAVAFGLAPHLVLAAPLDTTFNINNFPNPTSITNQYWPLIPGMQFVFTSTSDAGCEVELFAVTSNVKSDFKGKYAGMSAVEIHDQDWLSPLCDQKYALQEDTLDWHAQDRMGNVWYLGEASNAWDADQCPTTEGSWEAGANDAEAGIVMLADPQVGNTYSQEYSAGVAEDFAKVLRTKAPVSIGIGNFDGCLETKEWSPLEKGAVEHKFYCTAADGNVLIEELKGGRTLRSELVGDTLPSGEYAQSGVCP